MGKIVHLDTAADRRKWKVTVRPSKLLGRGKEKGLFAFDPELPARSRKIVFKKGDKIAPYLGEEISTKERQKRYGDKWGPYVYFKPWGHPSIDAQYQRSAAAYANDGAWVYSHKTNRMIRRKPNLSNAELKNDWLWATKSIRQADEILLDYGESYWKNLYQETKQAKQSGGGRSSIKGLTPVEQVNNHWVKREDTFQHHGAIGAKARSCLGIIEQARKKSPIKGLVTGGSRSSPQVEIVGKLASGLKLPARLHLPEGDIEHLKPYLRGHKTFQHFPGFNHVLSYQAHQDAEKTGYLEIPFGMESPVAVDLTARQVANLPKKCRRVILAVGSGMTLAGILKGLEKAGRLDLPIKGIVIGADPRPKLDEWAPGWRSKAKVSLTKSKLDYHQSAPENQLEWNGIELDPIYEAKVVPYLKDGDCFWIVGKREMKT